MNGKRAFLLMSLLTVLAMLLTACGGDTAATATAVPSGSARAVTSTPAASAGGKLEMFSWWTTGGEEAGLKAMYALYKKDHPNVDIVNQAVAGAAGSDAKAVLKSRMLGGDPPDGLGNNPPRTWTVLAVDCLSDGLVDVLMVARLLRTSP